MSPQVSQRYRCDVAYLDEGRHCVMRPDFDVSSSNAARRWMSDQIMRIDQSETMSFGIGTIYATPIIGDGSNVAVVGPAVRVHEQMTSDWAGGTDKPRRDDEAAA